MFRHQKIQLNANVVCCSDVVTKDRRVSEVTESINAGLGCDTLLKVFVCGLSSPAALFNTVVAHHTKLVESDRYSNIASMSVSPLGINLELLRNAPVAFVGDLSFLDENGAKVTDNID